MLLHQLSRTGFPIHTENFRSSVAPPTVKDGFSNSHRRLSCQRCAANCQGQVLQFTPKIFAPGLLHQLSRTGSPIHTENFVPALLHQLSRTGSPIHSKNFRSSVAPPTVKDGFSNSHRRLSCQRCSTNCQGEVLQFTPKTFVPALLHQLSRTGSPIHTENFRSSVAPPTVKDKFSNSHRRLSLQRCSTNCQGQVLQFTPKTFVPALLHQLSRTGSPIHTENFRSSAAPPTVKDKFSNSHRRLSFQRCSTNRFSRTGSPIHTEDFRSSAAPPTVKDKFSSSHRTFVPTLLQTVKDTPIHTEHFRSSVAPPTVKDRFSNSHRRLSLQRCSTNCQGQVLQFTPKTFVPALLHQLSRLGSPNHTEDFLPASPPTFKNRISNSHRRLSLQRCSTNCQGQDLQFTPKTSVPALIHQLRSSIHTELSSRTVPPTFKNRIPQFTPKTSVSSAAPPTVKNRFSNSHRRLPLQRCFTNCQRQVLQFTPKTFAPALLHQLSRTGSPIHTEDFRSSAAPPTVKDRFSDSHRRLSFQRWSTNFQGHFVQFTPKTSAPTLVHQLSRTSSPIHTEDFRSSAAPPTAQDMFSNSHRVLSFQRLSTNCQGQGFQFTPKTFVPALIHQLSRTGSPILTEDLRSSAAPPTVKYRISNSHRRLSLQRCSNNCQGQVFQFTPKTFVTALLHQLSRTGFPIHTEDFRSSAAPSTVKDRLSNSHRRLSFQRLSTDCQGQVLQFITEDLRSSAAPPTVKYRISNSHQKLSFHRCPTNFQGQ